MTYDEFYARFLAILTITPDSEPDFVTYLPEIIQDAEAMCYRDLDPIAIRKKATLNLAMGVPDVVGPADWLIGREARILVDGVSRRLQRMDDTFLSEYAADGVPSIPKYWTETGFQTFSVSPTPISPYLVTLLYTASQPVLSATNQTTWLTQWVPDLFFAAAMVQANAYQRNWSLTSDDPRQALSWKQQYDALLLSARHQEGRRKGDGVFDVSQSPPPPLSKPA